MKREREREERWARRKKEREEKIEKISYSNSHKPKREFYSGW